MKNRVCITTLALAVMSIHVTLADHHEKGESQETTFDLAGTWEATAATDEGSREFTLTFAEKDGTWTGKSVNAEGKETAFDQVDHSDGKVVVKTKVAGSNGESGVVRVTMEPKDGGETLSGRWSLRDDADSEAAGGDFRASKVHVLELEGEWVSVATVGEEKMKTLTVFEWDDPEWVGWMISEENKTPFSKVMKDGREVTIDFMLSIEGEDRPFRVKASSPKDGRLEGKWIMFDQSGQEGASGEWLAEKKTAALELEGEWKATSEINGETRQSTYVFAKGEEGYTGKVSNENGSLELSSVSVEKGEVTIKFPYGEAKVTIKAEGEDGKLVGKWAASVEDGTEHGGAWKAIKE